MSRNAQRGSDPAGRIQLEAVPLAVVETERLAGEALRERDGQHDGRVHPPAQENDGDFFRFHSLSRGIHVHLLLER